ncbi:hypothetical protein CEXT_358431 [Caerostris extrusa]|uniref:Uncharacterized protein n=1 Tax=Caerostris extrusa TaxID=172846 RepID=A0AAV4U0B9_CAEEX|nr:hypothetical protein CEXT_358431 [Caerostris extrusa]
MAFLARGHKEDLKVLTMELGVDAISIMKVIVLKKVGTTAFPSLSLPTYIGMLSTANHVSLRFTEFHGLIWA